jgi:hypothetical protein
MYIRCANHLRNLLQKWEREGPFSSHCESFQTIERKKLRGGSKNWSKDLQPVKNWSHWQILSYLKYFKTQW